MLEAAEGARLGRHLAGLRVRTGAVTSGAGLSERPSGSAVTVLRAARWADVEAGEVRSPAVVVIDGNRILAVNHVDMPNDPAEDIDLGDVTLIPGLMDMELNLL